MVTQWRRAAPTIQVRSPPGAAACPARGALLVAGADWGEVSVMEMEVLLASLVSAPVSSRRRPERPLSRLCAMYLEVSLCAARRICPSRRAMPSKARRRARQRDLPFAASHPPSRAPRRVVGVLVVERPKSWWYGPLRALHACHADRGGRRCRLLRGPREPMFRLSSSPQTTLPHGPRRALWGRLGARRHDTLTWWWIPKGRPPAEALFAKQSVRPPGNLRFQHASPTRNARLRTGARRVGAMGPPRRSDRLMWWTVARNSGPNGRMCKENGVFALVARRHGSRPPWGRCVVILRHLAHQEEARRPKPARLGRSAGNEAV